MGQYDDNDDDRPTGSQPIDADDNDDDEDQASQPTTTDATTANDDIWNNSSNEGYTPLLGMENDLMVSAGPQDDDDEGGRNGGGIFFVSPAAFVGTNNDLDFESIADRALSSLDAEYQAAIDGQPTRDHVAATPPDDDLKIIAAAFDRLKVDREQQPTIAAPDNCEPFELVQDWGESAAALPAFPRIEKDPPLPPDTEWTEGVKKAVATIAGKTNMSTKLQMWESSKYLKHGIIPEPPLKAYRRCEKAKKQASNTAGLKKAKQSTSDLSRSATLSDALIRLNILSKSEDESTEILTIHVVGVDAVECSSKERIQTLFGPFIRWLDYYLWKHIDGGDNSSIIPIRNVKLELIGRDLLPNMIHQSSLSLLGPNYRYLQSATATCHLGVYHEWLQAQESSISVSPNLQFAIAYNAGIWGYTEWEITLRELSKRSSPISFVITAYTLAEAQEDQAVIDAIAEVDDDSKPNHEPTGSAKCLWPAEDNPFGSRQIRDLQTSESTKEYRENAAWQAWSFGRSL